MRKREGKKTENLERAKGQEEKERDLFSLLLLEDIHSYQHVECHLYIE